jgi:pilus assembly protein Flp/PilA
MKDVTRNIARFVREDSGATMVEYAIMIALIAAICIAVIKVIGNKSNNAFENVNTAF